MEVRFLFFWIIFIIIGSDNLIRLEFSNGTGKNTLHHGISSEVFGDRLPNLAFFFFLLMVLEFNDLLCHGFDFLSISFILFEKVGDFMLKGRDPFGQKLILNIGDLELLLQGENFLGVLIFTRIHFYLFFNVIFILLKELVLYCWASRSLLS
jgi:hypothetical protein